MTRLRSTLTSLGLSLMLLLMNVAILLASESKPPFPK